MNRLLIISLALVLALVFSSEAQSITLNNDTLHKDSISNIHDFLANGHFHGHVRNHFMATINEGSLSDYWANGIGGSLGYTTASFKGFQLGVKGVFSYNIFSSNLNEVDSVSGKSAKWEKELFDVLDPDNKNDLDRLEELYIKYSRSKSSIAYGKMDINKEPLLLKRDGRMKPFVYKGLWAEINEFKDQEILLGWITHVSPRGMTEWFSLNEAVGINNNGFQPDGTKANYHDKAGTEGLGIFSYSIKTRKDIELKATNYYMHNMFDVVWLQADLKKEKFFGGLQYMYQTADKAQSELEYSERYYQPDETANIISGVLGFKCDKTHSEFSVAYLHGFDTGRFLFPRELTRENFYVSQPRSWVDGFGEVDIYMIRLKKKFQKLKTASMDLRIERVESPGKINYEQNKYGNSSYYQATFISHLIPKGKLEGVDFMLLYVYKLSEPELNLTEAEKFYKTNLHHINLIANFKF